jgi:hypothetical protein
MERKKDWAEKSDNRGISVFSERKCPQKKPDHDAVISCVAVTQQQHQEKQQCRPICDQTIRCIFSSAENPTGSATTAGSNLTATSV